MLVAAAPAAAKTALGPDAAIFLAAGLKQIHGHWESGCNEGNTDRNDPYQPAKITERKDLNGDGHPDAIISDGGVSCYGDTGQGFWIAAQQANGSWRLMLDATGIVVFRSTKGVDGWPDILIGGPGMCFPVVRWNGTAYKTIAFNDGEQSYKPIR